MRKQETLEEVAERLYPTQHVLSEIKQKVFIEGVKWQEQRMYSGQEVFNILMEFSRLEKTSSSGDPENIEHWFKQFKKK